MDKTLAFIISLVVILICLIALNYLALNSNSIESNFQIFSSSQTNSTKSSDNDDKNFGYYTNSQTCSKMPGCCSLTKYGCCPDGLNSRLNYFGSNCPRSYNSGNEIVTTANNNINNNINRRRARVIPPERRVRPIINPQVRIY